MKLFTTNPYRVLGIKANASAPEKQKVKNRIAAYIKVGKPPVLDFDLSPPLEKIIRAQELIDLKSNEILSDEDKIKHGLFWFVSGGIVDDIALSNLTEAKDIDKALANFEKGSQDFVVSERSISSIINHSTLEIICYPEHKDRKRLKIAINRKLEIASSDHYLSLLLNLLNPNNTTITSRVVKPEIVEAAKELLKELFRSEKEESLYLDFFSDQTEIIAELKEKNNQQLIRTIKEFVRNCENKRNQILDNETDKPLLNKSARIADDLLTQTENLLKRVSRVNGPDSIIVLNIYEEVINEVNYCAVGATNKFQEDFNRLVQYDKPAGIRYIKTNGKFCYDDILKVIEKALNFIKSINCPAREQITRNLEVLKSTQIDWRNLYDHVSQTNETAGTRGGTTSSSSNGAADSWIFIVIVIGAIVGLVVGGFGGLIGGGIAGIILVGIIANFTN
jgi:hypothetical protein